MKFLLLLLINMVSIAYANPFYPFAGKYETEGDGVVENSNMIECYWMYFNGIQQVQITPKENQSVKLSMISYLREMPLPSDFNAREYQSQVTDQTIHSARFAGDEISATYQVDRNSLKNNETLVWSISRTETKYELNIAYQRNGEACRFTTPMIKIIETEKN